MELTPGVYEHFKGKQYRVLGVGKDSETLGELVIYEPLYESDTKYWVRPLKMFTETVERDGKIMQRFKFLHE